MPQPRAASMPVWARVFVIVAVVAGFAPALVLTWRSSTALDERGATTTAQVISVDDHLNKAATATVRFDTADGRTITTRTRPDELVDPAPAVGSVIPIVYDPENPQAPVRDPRVPRDTPTSPLLVGGAGVILIAVLLVGMRRRRPRSPRAADGTS